MSKSKAPKRGAAWSAAEVVAEFPVRDLKELFRFWAGQRAAKTPADDEELKAAVMGFINDPEVLGRRISSLSSKLKAIFERHFVADDHRQRFVDLADAPELNYMSNYDIEAAITTFFSHPTAQFISAALSLSLIGRMLIGTALGWADLAAACDVPAAGAALSLRLEALGVETVEHRPLRAEHRQRRIPAILRHRRDRVGFRNPRQSG